MSYLFTSESVAAGHPDKVCDQISDALLDELLTHDRHSRAAIETVASGTQIHVLGEMRSTHSLSAERIREIVRTKLTDIGYTAGSYGADFNDANAVTINAAISQQSPDIAQGVDYSLEARSGAAQDDYDLLGAGDQGIVFGHASNELLRFDSEPHPATHSYLPGAIAIAHQLAAGYREVRAAHPCSFGPDAKTQVTLRYSSAGTPEAIDTVLVSAQHAAHMSPEEIRERITTELIDPIIAASGIPAESARLIINPSGRFIIGGPVGDAGLTGRKIVVDTYGGYAPHGGGAFSGKDPSKVDRSAAYAARWVAKNLVANGLVNRVTLQVSYAIGQAQPVSINVLSDTPERDAKLERLVLQRFDLRPAAIIERLGLDTFTQYQRVAAFGHFGRTDIALPWEELLTL